MQLPKPPDFFVPEPQSLLEQMWAGATHGMQPPASRPAVLVGECLDDRHPAVEGRFLIAYPNFDGGPHERWLGSLQGLRVRRGDRVVLFRPGNWPEPVVAGVICGTEDEAEPRVRPGMSVRLEKYDSVQVLGANGEMLVAISCGESGPMVQLLQPDVEIQAAGHLRISAKTIQLEARQGDVEVEARDDVVVRGDMIRLN